MKYPNINELVHWNYYGIPAMADHAGVTTELFEAVLKGQEELTDEELTGLSRLVNIPVGVLKQPQMAKMDCNKFQHCVKVLVLEEYFDFVKEKRTEQGQVDSLEIKSARKWLDLYIQYFQDGKGSYCGFRAVLHRIQQNMQLYQMDLKQPRGLKKSN